MYTILLNETNELTTTVRERIMQRSNCVDSLHFLVDPIYKGIDMTNFTVAMEYILPISKEYHSEILVKSEALYKEKLEYTLPLNTNLTKEHGDIEVQLTFTNVDLDASGKSIQYVRKTSPTVITILPITAWSEIIPDTALSALDQRLIKMDAQIKAIDAMNQVIINEKADDLSYNEDTNELQLMSGTNEIGKKVTIKIGADALKDGIPVIDFSNIIDGDTSVDESDNDNVVEF